MKILLTGSSGRIGRAIFGALAAAHEVVGLDRSPFATTRIIADVSDRQAVARAVQGVDAVIHTAALHAPHVGLVPDAVFQQINVEATAHLLQAAREAGARRFVLTSTTALYGHAVVAGGCRWIDEDTEPLPRTIYHRTKLQAETLAEAAATPGFSVRVLRMGRCFPEPPERMAMFRLHRGIDARDVASAHAALLLDEGAPFARYLACAPTPFRREDCLELATHPRSVLARRAPQLLAEFERRGWPLPLSIDRVYDSARLRSELGWQPCFGPDDVLQQYAVGSIEVLPRAQWIKDRVAE
ncbi:MULTISPECIES: NAD-dependent epimerase/dehydratase family protein [Stenotrophomonas]|uniref:NAD-dependent epimerase/dehydratase family protein n=1 Tax=Stenotrophomonas TaxID=40323 RepID=UPI0006579D57|nr:NAD(P)-dependent oxidoreductase [Stenotrophomonas maltophilia]CRQ81237.1 Cholesterol dehydrogenase [Pseudomonas aeruginosa]MBA0226014.1 NAD(P)-dependent oxidoreductase [Stenotrophomonas maltophilia]MBA0366862.1 NAD(P)-dependent oxidoreductase [Stenotrophomonas maltophilia]MBA0402710.1 NAD(P)-dependent oxidoreductase [Stenotrophomonas maltophilia]MCF3521286.1 NAD-dependent epimerase/dehydratase family protein [Stenotrophomonas maltophilia]